MPQNKSIKLKVININFRIGHGYDVHKFVADRQLILGGCKIPFKLGLLGHSDADVLAHSIIDSLLGASAQGDIGTLFPDFDDAFLGANSLEMLKGVHNKVNKLGFKIINIDCTLVAQAPKLAGYIQNMRQNIATVCSLEISKISIKATTEEGLGFTGNLSGIKSYAVCLLQE